jgi:hypothetical protein
MKDIICDTPEKINAFRLLTLRSALKLEIAGLRASRGFSAYKVIKTEFGFKGDKQSVSDQFAAYLTQIGVLVPKAS